MAGSPAGHDLAGMPTVLTAPEPYFRAEARLGATLAVAVTVLGMRAD